MNINNLPVNKVKNDSNFNSVVDLNFKFKSGGAPDALFNIFSFPAVISLKSFFHVFFIFYLFCICFFAVFSGAAAGVWAEESPVKEFQTKEDNHKEIQVKEARKVYYSKKPDDEAGVLNEISRYIDSLTVHIKNLNILNDVEHNRSFAGGPQSDETALTSDISIFAGYFRHTGEFAVKFAGLKKDYELLYRDFVSLKVKNEIIKTEQSIKKNSVSAFDFKNANLSDISYEITLLESVLNAKRFEISSLKFEIDSASKNQDRFIDSVLTAGVTFSAGDASFEALHGTLLGFEKHGLDSASAEVIFKTAGDYYNGILARYFELKLYCLSRQKKIIEYEISATRRELEEKKQLGSFIRENSSLLSTNTGASGLSTVELEISRFDLTGNKLQLEDSLKKIGSIAAEIKKEKKAAESGVASPARLRYLNLNLQYEQELLKHKSSLSNETDEFSKFLIKIANYSTKAANEEADNIQKLYYFTGASDLYEHKNAILVEIEEYVMQKEEAISLGNLIKSGRIKIEHQLKILNGDLLVKQGESIEITLQAGGLPDKDIKTLKAMLKSIIEALKARISINEQYVQSAVKYENWLIEKNKTIDSSVKLLSAMLNQLEERLDLKTVTEAFNSFRDIFRKIYRGIEKVPAYIFKIFTSKDKFFDFILLIKFLFIISLLSYVIYKLIDFIFAGRTSGSLIKTTLRQILPYIIFMIAVKVFSDLCLREPAVINILTLTVFCLSITRILLITLNNFSLNKSLDADIYFRLSLFIKYFFFSTVALIIAVSISSSMHLVIFAKFCYKTFGLLLAVILIKKYSKRLLSCLYLSKRRLKLKGYNYAIFHLASLYNHLLHKYHALIFMFSFAALIVYFAGYDNNAFYIIYSSFFTILLYSVLFLVPKFSMTTFEWFFRDESAVWNLNSYIRFRERALVYIKIFYRLFFFIIFIFFTLKIWGIQVNYIFKLLASDIIVLIGRKIIFILAVIAMGFIVWHLIERFIDDLFKSALSHQRSDNIKKRGATIAPLLKSSAKYLIWFLGIYLILEEIGVDVTPIVAGAGIFALAIGFGSQNLVKDIVAGFFIIFEDQYNVGDYVTIEGISGTVEEISIRITKIRDLFGTLHIIPNGAISRVSNFSKDYSISRFEIGVAYESDFDKALKIVQKTASELCADWHLFIIEPAQVLGIVSLGESDVVIRTQTKLSVGKRVDFECELRKRILKNFKENGIGIPYKRLVVINQHDVQD